MSGKRKHTPGPFIAQFCDIYEVNGMTRIAEVFPRNPPDWTPEDHANAMLFAAVTKLLAACQAIDAASKHYVSPSPLPSAVEEAMIQVRAAIEEATH